MPKKVWIKGFEGLYQIDEDGNIYSFKRGKEKLLSPQRNTKGYAQVRLYDKERVGYTVRVHRLVSEHFLPNPDGLPQTDYIDENKLNNSVKNLRWVNNQTNCAKSLSKIYYLQHRDGTGLFVRNLSEWCRTFKKDIATLHKLMNRQRKSAYGFIEMEVYHS